MKESLKIIGSSILLAICYGIFHDFITAHLAIEYFTIGHPKIIKSESPFVLAIIWGTIATWWVGLILGVLLLMASRTGKHPKLPFKAIIPYQLRLLTVMSLTAFLGGVIGFTLSKLEFIYLMPNLSERILQEKQNLYLAVLWAHSSSYLTGLLGGIVTCILIWKSRKKSLSNNHDY